LTASYTAPCTIAKLSGATCGGCPAVDMIEVEAIAFQSVAALPAGCAPAGAESQPTAAASSTATVIRLKNLGCIISLPRSSDEADDR
jgi:hypothetical protein